MRAQASRCQENDLRIGYLSAAEAGETDRMIKALAATLEARGFRLSGTVQTNPPRDGAAHTDMDLWLLPKGPEVRISQTLGPGSSGCRLDPGALEDAVAETARRLPGAEVLIVNKFGRQEAEGRGFRLLLAEALDQGIPVIIGVSPDYLADFEAFAGDSAQPLPIDVSAVLRWLSEK